MRQTEASELDPQHRLLEIRFRRSKRECLATSEQSSGPKSAGTTSMSASPDPLEIPAFGLPIADVVDEAQRECRDLSTVQRPRVLSNALDPCFIAEYDGDF